MTKQVLIIEDELSLALLVQDYLRRESIESDILGSGENAVDIILSAKPDLVILDIMLPGMDGLEICRKVRNQSDVPIIVETAELKKLTDYWVWNWEQMTISVNHFHPENWLPGLKRFCDVLIGKILRTNHWILTKP
jgi:CheY-like chemotaxis protein